MSTDSIGQRLRQARSTLGLTQEQVADAIHVSRQTVSNWENDRSLPNYTTLNSLTQLLQLDLATFLPAPDTITAALQEDLPAPAVASKRKLPRYLLPIFLVTILVVALAVAANHTKAPQPASSDTPYSLAWFAQEEEVLETSAYLRIYSHDDVVYAKRGSPNATPLWRYNFYLQEEHNIGLEIELLCLVLFSNDKEPIIQASTDDEIRLLIGSIYIGPKEIRWFNTAMVADSTTIGVGCVVEGTDNNGNTIISKLYLPLENEFD